jgi:hypothetical protein
MGRVAFNDAGFDGVGEDATKERPTVRVAVPAPPRTMAFPRSFLVLTATRVFPAMMSLRTLLMSVLVRSLTRLVPVRGNDVPLDTACIGDGRRGLLRSSG